MDGIAMKGVGGLLIGIGCVALLISWGVDTTVETGGEVIGYGAHSTYVPRSRVHNIGLVEQRRNYLMISSLVTVVGVLLFGFGTLAENQAKATQPPSGPRCPKCNGVLEGTPELCKHCRAALGWVDGKALTPEDAFRILAERGEQRLRYKEQVQREEAARLERNRKMREGICKAGQSVLNLLPRFDDALHRMVGEENQIIYRFLQWILYFALPIAVALAIVATRR